MPEKMARCGDGVRVYQAGLAQAQPASCEACSVSAMFESTTKNFKSKTNFSSESLP